MNIETLLKIIADIEAANPGRDYGTLPRRILKIGEEVGEISGAFLGVTSEGNYKGKTMADVREEAVDALIVAIDVALTALPNRDKTAMEGMIADGIIERILSRALEPYPTPVMDAIFTAHTRVGRAGTNILTGSPISLQYQLEEIVAIILDITIMVARMAEKATHTDYVIGIVDDVERKLAKWRAIRDQNSNEE